MSVFYFSDISPERKGNGGESIYGPTFEGKKHINISTHLHYYNCSKSTFKFSLRVFTCVVSNVSFLLLDESFAVSHTKRGTLGMANKGPHSNGSQFYITLQPTPWMDRTYVAFGFVSLIWLETHLFNWAILHNLRALIQFLFKPNVFDFHSSQVVEGVDVLRRLEEAPTCNERPKYECKVTDCGVFQF